MVRALATCPGIDAHLVLVTRKVEGTADLSPGYYHKRRRCCYYDDYSDDGSDDDGGGHTMADVSRGFGGGVGAVGGWECGQMGVGIPWLM